MGSSHGTAVRIGDIRMPGWRGRIGQQLPDGRWRQAMDFSRKPPNAERGLNALRDEQTRIVRRIVIESDTPCVVSDDGRTLTMTAAACARLREQLAERGIDSLSIEADALSRNIIAGGPAPIRPSR